MKTPPQIFTLFLMVLIFTSCTGYKTDLYNEINKIDAHVHIRTDDPSIMEFAKAEGFKLLTI